MKKNSYYTYMVRCADGSLYTGFTTDPEAREAMHNSGRGAKYTASRRPVRLVWQRRWDTEHEARSAEIRIKRMKKKEKEALVVSFERKKNI